jgi:PAS domain S-box-containing protein
MDNELGRFVDALHGLVWTLLSDGKVDYVNFAWNDYSGLNLAAASGEGWLSIVHPEDLSRLLERWNSLVESGKGGQTEVRLRRIDGAYRWFNLSFAPLSKSYGFADKWCAIGTDIDAYKQAEANRLASEENFKTIINTLPTSAWSTRPDGYCDFLSDRWLEYAGYTAEEALGWGWGKSIHPDDVAGLVSYWRECVATGTPADAEARMRRADGEYRWFLLRANPMRDAGGAIVRWYGTNIDIEDRRQAEDKLRRSEALLAEGQRLSSTGSFSWHLDTDEVVLSEELHHRILEFDPDTVPTLQRIISLVHPEDIPQITEHMKNVRAGADGERYEIRLQMPNGAVKHVYVIQHRVAQIEERPVVMGSIGDITKSKKAEELIRRNAEYLSAAEALSKTGSVTFNWSKDERHWSDELYRIWEFEVGSDITLTMVSDRIHPDDRHIFRDFTANAVGKRDFGFRLRMPDGRIKYLHAVTHAFRVRPDALAEGVAAIQDVTQQREFEEALAKVRSELAHVARVTALGTLTASIAHEVNQPLSGIITNASTCLRMLATDPPNVVGARETAKRAIRDGNRAAQVIARLRALFAGKTALTDAVDLSEATREIMVLSANELQRNRILLQAELAEQLPQVVGDRVQLQQVILNLFLNAIEAMSAIEDRPRRLVVRTELAENCEIRVAVKDVGVGFDAQEAEHLFEPFHTTKIDGMGIGLSVSRSIVESHGGRIWAHGNDGPGATFVFCIPIGSDILRRVENHAATRALH